MNSEPLWLRTLEEAFRKTSRNRKREKRRKEEK